MKVLHVGGKHFFNRFSNLEAAVLRAENDDIIELHKDVHDAELFICKNITINGNGHLITPAYSKPALDCAAFITLNDIQFDCKPRTNAVIIRDGGNLTKITTRIIGPARALYPTIIQREGTLTIKDSSIMYMETHKTHHETKPSTILDNCHLTNYFGGFAYLNDDDRSLSKFRRKTVIMSSHIWCALFEGECELNGVVLHNFNKVTGTVKMTLCDLHAARGTITKHPDEPFDGPLKNLNPKVIPYALHIDNGQAIVEKFASVMDDNCIGFYMTSGSLSIKSTENHNVQARHLIKGGSVIFNDVTDDGFYEIKKARCGIVRSRVNASTEMKSALDQLDTMIGLDSVKRQIRTIMNTISVNMRCPEKDFGFSHHMIFAGDPGTGKTTAAKLVAQALFEIGAIPENKCMEVPASQMIKGFVGQTGEHVESILKKALGGVLFIDEAYELMVKDNQNTFNNDVLAVLLRYMEDHRKDLVVIAAGYEKEMREFLASNVGLTRRFQWVYFEDYTPEEMAEIFLSMSEQYKESFDFAEPIVPLASCFETLTGFYLNHPDAKGRVTNGGNGGLARNLFQQVIFARNNRIADYPESTMKITENDIQAGFHEELNKAMNVS